MSQTESLAGVIADLYEQLQHAVRANRDLTERLAEDAEELAMYRSRAGDGPPVDPRPDPRSPT